jgi:hypothetical protein
MCCTPGANDSISNFQKVGLVGIICPWLVKENKVSVVILFLPVVSVESIHIPDGTIPMAEVASYCQRYEEMIQEAGGLDVQV